MIDSLISNGYTLDLDSSVPFPITFSIADITEIDKRSRNVSKKITLPGTSNNCNFFASTFGYHAVNSNIIFDATQKVSAIYYKKGVAIMPDAIIKLEDAVISNGNVQFTITLYSEVVDYFLLLSNIKVAELGWSEYDHTLNRTNIKASWLTPNGSGYRYPLIERGNGRAGTTIWNTTDIVPYVFFREVLIKMFDYVGITVESEWLDSDRVKSIMFGFGGGDAVLQSLNPSDINQRKVSTINGALGYTVNRNASPDNVGGWRTSPMIYNTIEAPIFTNTTSQDLLNQYSDGAISIQRSGNYRISLTGELKSEWTNSGGLTLSRYSARLFYILKNGVVVSISPQPLNTVAQWSIATTIDISALSGDVITFAYLEDRAVFTGTNPTDTNCTNTLTTPIPISITLESIDTSLTDGGTVSLFKFIPDMKCSDFLLGAIRLFNLQMTDSDIDGVTYIEPLSDFYSSTNVFEDITGIVDHSKPIRFTPTGNALQKNINLKWKENKDFDALKYADKWGNGYGDNNYEQGSYFAKGKQKIELPFSSIVPYEISTGILVPRFISIDGATVKPNKGAGRLAIWNGLKSGAWVFRNTDNPASQENLTTYPCIHHFDNWQDPTFDLNFQLVSEVYYSTSVVTTVNSYSEYYSDFINELVSPVGTRVNLWVKYTQNDIKNLSFAKLKMINGALFRLNIVKEFDNDKAESTNIELIKLVKAKKPRTGKIIFTPVADVNTDVIAPPVGTGVDVPKVPSYKDAVLLNSAFIKSK